MTLATSTLRPGLLVSLNTSLRGNVRYETVDVESRTKERAVWETTRTTADPEEYERGKKAQGLAITAVRRVCTKSAFGLLCPEADAAELDDAIRTAKQIAEDFNRTASVTHLRVYVMTGKVASDDVEAVKKINSEVRELIDQMARSVKEMDVETIRKTATKAKDVASMLSPEAEARVKIAIDTARSVAKGIVKAGEAAEVEIDQRAIRKITEQRVAFLDLRDETEVKRVRAQGRAIDFAPME